jgi:hypothetical protein
MIKISKLSGSTMARGILAAILMWILIMVATSCVSEKRRGKICATCPVKTDTKVVDSSAYRELNDLYDTLVEYKKRTGQPIFIKGNCDSLLKALTANHNTITTKSKEGVKTSIIKTDTGFLIKCDVDAYKDTIKALRKTIWNEHFKKTVIETTLPPVEVERALTWWQKFFIVCGKIFILCVFITGVYLFLKLKP